MKVRCLRCGRDGEASPPVPPDGWEGSISEPICPGCQSAEWHPHCTSVRAESGYGQRIDLEALARGESTTVDVDGVPVVLRSTSDAQSLDAAWCDYIDLSIARTDGDADWLTEWRCDACGGTGFEWVHADYMQSGLGGTSFDLRVEEDDT